MNRSGIMTTYKDINFRSRLEARWAAFFDLVDWAWEYEPDSPGAYIPDFLLHGEDGRRVFVEVKPLGIWHADRPNIITKIRSAVGDHPDVLVLTDQPFDTADGGALGYMPPSSADHSGAWDVGEFDRLGTDEEAQLIRLAPSYHQFDINHTWGSWQWRLHGGIYTDNSEFLSVPFAEVMKIWSRAGNAIQWKPNHR